ncbi:DNA mismatch repair protein MutL [Ammoniphilus oxalaticus]|uniref:DNA mismatch repair protein MutL n=1 Tax=Ammoniphilus oxalaticus TaxID=66863 RepID=A0A419SK47_9BACL|nr:DNA mismatch repair endonuclease MutL [Ammoniphilus oxalaticus]RKD24309.1 DNA mismatch repair protein MutL [Ammoniphilus oxalaticus]
MNSIQVLEEQLSNMIAAGEVVERPASVVKELVENAVDAGSRSIEVHVEEAGLKLIKVVDDGRGMSADDCKLCFERHATSKIRRARDLFQIATLGFRGEALPSIAAVSRIELTSCQAPGQAATKLVLEGGACQHIETTARPKGTEIKVHDLFFNTPARLKYIKSIPTELGHISDYLNRLALSFPEISFLLVSNGRTLLRTYGDGQLIHAISAIYGMAIAKEMKLIQAEDLDFKLHGYVGNPQVTRANRSYISLLINGRYIRHSGLIQAILRGYHTLLPIHRYPIVVLSITMEPSLVDVNVHPAKLEARFSKEQELIAFVEEQVKRVLREQRLIPEPTRQVVKSDSVQTSFSIAETRTPWNDQISRGQPGDAGADALDRNKPTVEQSQPYTDQGLIETAGPSPAEIETSKEEEWSSNSDEEQMMETEQQQEQNKVPLLDPLAQLHGTYILAQSEEGMYMIDQHAAQERIWYEYFMEKLKQEKIETQELLVPISIDLSFKEMQQVEEKMELFQQVGIDLEPFGQQTFLIRSHPIWFTLGEEEAIIHEMVDMIVRGEAKIDTVKIREEAAITMSCKAAIKANRHLSQLEMEALLNQLRTTSSPYTCPHGRPIIVHFSTYEIEKMFKRVM